MVERKVLIYYFIQSIFICRRQYKKMYMRILWMCLSVKLSTWLSLNLRNAYEISFVLGYDDFDTVKSWRRRGKKSTLRRDKKVSREADLNHRPKDDYEHATTVLRSFFFLSLLKSFITYYRKVYIISQIQHFMNNKNISQIE